MKKTEDAFVWIINVLKKHRVPFHITGGLAAQMYGSQRQIYYRGPPFPGITIAFTQWATEVQLKNANPWNTVIGKYEPTPFQLAEKSKTCISSKSKPRIAPGLF